MLSEEKNVPGRVGDYSLAGNDMDLLTYGDFVVSDQQDDAPINPE